MKMQDPIFGLLGEFANAVDLETSADGRFVCVTTESGNQIFIADIVFSKMALVNDRIASNVRKENPYAPYASATAQSLKIAFIDMSTIMRMEQWRTKVGSEAVPTPAILAAE
ncbi:MAG: hypothetical protein ACRBCT_09835 [Alphaproteobacteria bacterium]